MSNDWVVRHDNRSCQIERQSHRPPAKWTVIVPEAATQWTRLSNATG